MEGVVQCFLVVTPYSLLGSNDQHGGNTGVSIRLFHATQ